VNPYTVSVDTTKVIQSDQLDAVRQADPWYALRVRSNFERIAARHLRQRGFEEFLPSVKGVKRWSDRKKIAETLLFPGYVFCRLDSQNQVPILTVPGVVALVSFGEKPTPVPDSEVERVRMVIESGLLVTPWPYLEVGERVLIERGPLTGLEGILERIKGQLRLVVSVTMLQRSVSTEIDRDWIRPLRTSAEKQRSSPGAASLVDL
jgi:transcriptional antiterminator NusG